MTWGNGEAHPKTRAAQQRIVPCDAGRKGEKHDSELGQPKLQSTSTCIGDRSAVVPSRQLVVEPSKVLPGVRKLPSIFLAVTQIEQRARLGIRPSRKSASAVTVSPSARATTGARTVKARVTTKKRMG